MFTIRNSLREKTMASNFVKEPISNLPYYPPNQTEKEIIRSNAKGLIIITYSRF